MRRQLSAASALAELDRLANALRASEGLEADLAYVQFVNTLGDVASRLGIPIGSVLRESEAREREARSRRASEMARRERVSA